MEETQKKYPISPLAFFDSEGKYKPLELTKEEQQEASDSLQLLTRILQVMAKEGLEDFKGVEVEVTDQIKCNKKQLNKLSGHLTGLYRVMGFHVDQLQQILETLSFEKFTYGTTIAGRSVWTMNPGEMTTTVVHQPTRVDLNARGRLFKANQRKVLEEIRKH